MSDPDPTLPKVPDPGPQQFKKDKEQNNFY
jgi:hypothetical protein